MCHFHADQMCTSILFLSFPFLFELCALAGDWAAFSLSDPTEVVTVGSLHVYECYLLVFVW